MQEFNFYHTTPKGCHSTLKRDGKRIYSDAGPHEWQFHLADGNYTLETHCDRYGGSEREIKVEGGKVFFD